MCSNKFLNALALHEKCCLCGNGHEQFVLVAFILMEIWIIRDSTTVPACCRSRATRQQICPRHTAMDGRAPCCPHLAESGTRRTTPEVSLTPSTVTTASHRCARRVPRLGLNMPAEEAKRGFKYIKGASAEGGCSFRVASCKAILMAAILMAACTCGASAAGGVPQKRSLV